MNNFSTEAFLATLALIGAVIVISALLSGFIEKTGVPQVAVFLALGAMLGPAGLAVVNINLESPVLRVVATLSLVLVLFTDAVNLDIKEVRQSSRMALMILGPGTLLSAGLIGLAGWGLFGLAPAAAAILGAALASTDPVLLRGMLNRRDIPATTRQALRLESGMNDVVLLPIIFVAIAFAHSGSENGATDFTKMALSLFLLGPGAGIAIGLLAVATLDLVRRRLGVRRDYEALYSLGVAFAAYAAAEALHGSGFLAVFAAGLTISALDVELCDCFLEYGETTAEMALLFTFVLFGSSLIWTGLNEISLVGLVFVLVVLVARPVALLISLARARLEPRARFLIAWMGPRGLSSLLLVLLPVFDGVPGSRQLFTICCLVVLVSVVLHGGFSPQVISRSGRKKTSLPAEPVKVEPLIISPEGLRLAHPDKVASSPPEATRAPFSMELTTRPALAETTAPVVASTSNGKGDHDQPEAAPDPNTDLITMEELQKLGQAGQEVIVLDVRTERSFNQGDSMAKGALRMVPENVVQQATALKLPRAAHLIAYCA